MFKRMIAETRLALERDDSQSGPQTSKLGAAVGSLAGLALGMPLSGAQVGSTLGGAVKHAVNSVRDAKRKRPEAKYAVRDVAARTTPKSRSTSSYNDED